LNLLGLLLVEWGNLYSFELAFDGIANSRRPSLLLQVIDVQEPFLKCTDFVTNLSTDRELPFKDIQSLF